MKKMTRWLVKGAGAALLVAFVATLGACTTEQSGATGDVAAAGSPAANAMDVATGAQLWAENCGHCHNIRSPETYSDSQWQVATMHMRLRANLTAREERLIYAFLKSAH